MGRRVSQYLDLLLRSVSKAIEINPRSDLGVSIRTPAVARIVLELWGSI